MDAHISKYRKLLVAEESLSTLDETLSLVQSLLGGNIEPQGSELAIVLRGKESVPGLNGWLGEVARELDLTGLARGAKARKGSARNRQREARVLHCAVHLSLVPMVVARIEPSPSEARMSLLLDACLLLFHQTYFALLPELRDGWETERHSLLISFELFAERQSRAADRFNVLALTYDALGNATKAAECYRELVAATSSDSHDFMTCLQSAWSYLVEHDRTSEAFEFLIDTMPRVTLADQEEFRTLLKQTFSLAHSHA